jgi:nucleoside 2-deoxyribosyltransferase
MNTPVPRSVYIAGALTDMTELQRAKLRLFYESLGATCAEFGLTPYLPHQHSDPTLMTSLTQARVDRVDRLAVTSSYLVVAYVGVPSVGIGIEVEMAYHAGKPVVLIAEQTKFNSRRISRLVRGNPGVIAEIGFSDYFDAQTRLRSFLTSFTADIMAENLPAPLSLAR